MTDAWQPHNDKDDASPFDQLLERSSESESATVFTTAFRGYDKDEVDAAIGRLTAQVRAEGDKVASLRDQLVRDEKQAETRHGDALEWYENELRDARQKADDADAKVAEVERRAERLEDELNAAGAKLSDAEQKIQALSEELVESSEESAGKAQFEDILRVAEDQASTIIRNASTQADRLMAAAREEIAHQRAEAVAEADAITARAEHDAQQARLRIDTELTAHTAQLEREAAHAAEKVAQADREAAAIRTESEKGAAALRSLVARETQQARGEAEDAVRELRVRALEFEESLTRRQDDAQQEFLALHNQAVAHAERITVDANEQVAASLDHAQRVSAKAEDFDRLMRAQAQQIEADAHVRAGEILERARGKAEKIISTVTGHSQSVLRDAEDRARQLRWQQHQLTSFMSEVKELIRPEQSLSAARAEGAALAGTTESDHVQLGDESEADTTDSESPDADDPDVDLEAEYAEEFHSESVDRT